MTQTLPDVIRNIYLAAQRRVDAARAAGGLPLIMFVEQGLPKPEGYWYDPLTEYYIPDTVQLLPIQTDLIRDFMEVSSHG